jgi:predicted amidohydrolase YtcJ
VLRLEASRFLALARDAQQKGFRVATHAIGDRAIDLVLEVYTKLHAEFGDRRSRIEHFGLPTPEHVMAMEAYTFVAVTQPIFLEELGENFIGALDDEYLASCYPIASLLKRTIPVAFSTDAPVVANLNPWNNIQCSLERKSRSGKTIAVEESVTLEQALRAYTAGSAFAEGKEHLKGALAPGQYADFIVVDRDPFGIPVQELRTLRVEETFVNGICRWPGKKIEGH